MSILEGSLICLMLLKWQINGLNFGLFFNEKIFKTALLFSASAPNPYTVSVGMHTLSFLSN